MVVLNADGWVGECVSGDEACLYGTSLSVEARLLGEAWTGDRGVGGAVGEEKEYSRVDAWVWGIPHSESNTFGKGCTLGGEKRKTWLLEAQGVGLSEKATAAEEDDDDDEEV